jgi:7,8-dihydropterin-6-yl-methyl-4-(beta-D-ribofuranosyl)aminobenzene 5'-phosphate synthase
MKVQVLYDKNSIARNLYTGWGVSFLIDEEIIFDTGESGRRLLGNMKRLGIDIDKIKMVVISHDHWDHTGGLWSLLKSKEGLKTYGCPGFSQEFKEKVKKLKSVLIEADGFTEIKENVFITGEIAGEYKRKYIGEQALIIRKGEKLTIITGCSHPGIIKIINRVKENFPGMKIGLVFGGFHLLNKKVEEIASIAEEFKESGIEKAGPTHCSGEDAEEVFKKLYKDNFISIKVGQTLCV